MEIETQRLQLREWCDADLAPFAALNSDARVMEHFLSTIPPSESDAHVQRIQQHFETHGYGLFAVERKQEGDFIGFVGLSEVTFEAAFLPAVEIGWRLAHHAWGMGYASEAALACLRVAFELLALDEVVSFTASGNARSRAVMQRIGLRHDAALDFDHPRVPKDHPISRHVLYRIERTDWQARNAATRAG